MTAEIVSTSLRYRSSAMRTCSSASLRALMSNRTPCPHRRPPSRARLVPEERRGWGADVRDGPPGLRAVHVGHGGELLDEGSIRLLGPAEPGLGELAFGGVGGHAPPYERMSPAAAGEH